MGSVLTLYCLTLASKTQCRLIVPYRSNYGLTLHCHSKTKVHVFYRHTRINKEPIRPNPKLMFKTISQAYQLLFFRIPFVVFINIWVLGQFCEHNAATR